jgi:hypothetical protein
VVRTVVRILVCLNVILFGTAIGFLLAFAGDGGRDMTAHWVAGIIGAVVGGLLAVGVLAVYFFVDKPRAARQRQGGGPGASPPGPEGTVRGDASEQD